MESLGRAMLRTITETMGGTVLFTWAPAFHRACAVAVTTATGEAVVLGLVDDDADNAVVRLDRAAVTELRDGLTRWLEAPA